MQLHGSPDGSGGDALSPPDTADRFPCGRGRCDCSRVEGADISAITHAPDRETRLDASPGEFSDAETVQRGGEFWNFPPLSGGALALHWRTWS